MTLLGIDGHQLLLFVAAGWLLNLTPGPDVFYIVTHALRSGARAGIVAGLGITAGCFVHVAAAALGVSALLATSAAAFTVLKWAGAAYLVYVGVRMLRARPGQGLAAVARSAGTAAQAATTCVPVHTDEPPPEAARLAGRMVERDGEPAGGTVRRGPAGRLPAAARRSRWSRPPRRRVHVRRGRASRPSPR